jgi:hypothetical protein
MISTARRGAPKEEHAGSTPHLEVGNNVAKFFSNIANALENGVQALRLFISNLVKRIARGTNLVGIYDNIIACAGLHYGRFSFLSSGSPCR